MIFTYRGVELVPEREMAEMIGRTPQTLRYFTTDRDSREGMACYRDGAHLYFPISAVFGYAFARQGVTPITGADVLHIDRETGERYICTTCSYTNELCPAAARYQEDARRIRSWDSPSTEVYDE